MAAADALQIFGAEKRGEVENFDIKKKQSQDEMEHSIFGTFRLTLRHDQSMKNHNVQYELLEDRQYKSKR